MRDAQDYTWQTLADGFRPGMGQFIPDRFFWAGATTTKPPAMKTGAMTDSLRGLYAITPETPDGGRLLANVEAALAGGCRLVQYRDKTSLAPERVARAQALRRLTLAHGARLIDQ